MTISAASAIRMEVTAMASAPPNVASAGTISRKSERTIRIESSAATSEKKASRRAQMARRE